MDKRHIGLTSCVTLLVALSCGCKKSTPESPAPARPQPQAETIARVHWLGKKQLAAETNAAFLMGIWNLPESKKLEAQTLNKLLTASWRLLRGEGSVTNASSALLRPLLDDVVQEESYLETRHATNQPAEAVFAIRLNDARGALWKTNLATAVASLSGVRPVVSQDNPRGWSLKKHDAPNLIELTRVGEWTVVGLAQEHNALFGEIVARIQRERAPFFARATNFWLEADLDLRGVASALSLGWNLPGDLPKMSVAVIGNGENVITRGQLNFAKPLPFEPEPWNIPTNLVQEPLISFTAIQGVKPWLASRKTWNDLQIGEPPNQLYFWALDGSPFQSYFAVPLPDASNQVHSLTEILLRDGNPWLATNGMGSFERSRDLSGAVWTGVFFMSPFMQSTGGGKQGVVFGGLFPGAGAETNRPPPAELLQQISGRTNLVCYDWEITGPRIGAWIHIGQLFRVVLYKAQLPRESASLAWFQAVIPKLGNCATVVTRTEQGQLSFVRKSSVGFTAIELHLLADWLESPQFPRGLHTFLAPPEMTPPPPATPAQH